MIRRLQTCLLILLAPAAACAAPMLSLRPEASVSDSQIRLMDLLDGHSGLPEGAGETRIGMAPPLGSGEMWDRERIATELRQRLGLREISWEGAQAVRVSRPARTLGVSQISELLRRRIQEQLGSSGRAEIVRIEGEPILFPEAATAVEIELSAVSLQQRRPVAQIRFLEGTTPLLTRQVRFEWRNWIPAYRSTRRLNRGDSLASAVEQVEVDAHSTPGAMTPRTEENSGEWMAARELPAGRILTSGDVARRPLILQGETVAVLVELPSTLIRLEGIALGPGARGDVIQIMNPTTRRRISAVVTGEGTALFSPARS
jgi:flagella basal body P-ring formation protein FlgA